MIYQSVHDAGKSQKYYSYLEEDGHTDVAELSFALHCIGTSMQQQ